MTITIDNITRHYGQTAALSGLTLRISKGESLTLFGPSGSGKTTLLRMLAGFESPDQGEIRFDGRRVSTPRKTLAPHRRGVGMVFQDLALWPHMTVKQHLDFALAAAIGDKRRRARKIDEALFRFRLEAHPDKPPRKLSGGERQRLAIARAVIPEPAVLLLDEPLSSLDSFLRSALLKELKTIITATGMTVVHVTHEWSEAIFLSRRIVMMKNGKLERILPADTLRTHAESDAEIKKIPLSGHQNPALDRTI